MRGTARIDYKPYLPPIFFGAAEKPYICRLAPSEFGFEFEWFDNKDGGVHTLYYKKRGGEMEESAEICDPVVSVDKLDTDCDYEFYIKSKDGRQSNVRLVRTGAIPEGTSVINYLHPEDTQYDFSGSYIASPSIVRTATGRLIATMDLFGHETAQNLTLLFFSDDDGKTWHYLTDLYPFFWSCASYYRNVLYVIGFTTEYGDLRITCSKDDGATWSEAVTLFHGSNRSCGYGGRHRAPMHFISHNGRLYTSCEYGCWATSHLPGVLSIDENDDLMVPENWTCSDFLPFDGEWEKAAGTQGDTIEGNMVVAPDGNLYNIMRWKIGSMLKLKVNTHNLDVAPEFADIVEAPVSNSMFRLFKCDDKYVLITNRKTEVSSKYEAFSYRSVLSMYTSYDLENFTFVKDIVNFENEDAAKFGFQYPAFIKEDNTILIAIRSAFNNAPNYHDSNYILFYKTEVPYGN